VCCLLVALLFLSSVLLLWWWWKPKILKNNNNKIKICQYSGNATHLKMREEPPFKDSHAADVPQTIDNTLHDIVYCFSGTFANWQCANLSCMFVGAFIMTRCLKLNLFLFSLIQNNFLLIQTAQSWGENKVMNVLVHYINVFYCC
jgi:hypothetical protein